MGITCDWLWLRKLAKAMDKALERQNGIFGTIIYEKQLKLGEKGGKRSHVACEEETKIK